MNVTYKKVIIVSVIIMILIVYCFIQNIWIDVEKFNVKIDKLTSDFSGLRIAQISDTHLPNSKTFTDNIIEKVSDEKPDIILMTGDLVNRTADIEESGLAYMCKKLSEIAPCYAVSGNHEVDNDYKVWLKILTDNEVKVIDNKVIIFEKEKNKIAFMGLKFGDRYKRSKFNSLSETKNIPRILLAHNPEYFEDFFSTKNNCIPDLVLCGHAHGGQVRIPFINKGLFAPGQGVFPEYTSGEYKSETGGEMILSRGLGNGTVFIRINNRVHIPIIDINN